MVCPYTCPALAQSNLHTSADQSGTAQLQNPLNIKPSGNNGHDGSSSNNGGGGGGNVVVPASPATPADATATPGVSSAGGSAWDLACLGGPGWGSPDTSESPAAGVWAAIPPLSALESERVGSPRPSWAVFGSTGGTPVVERGGGGSGCGTGGGAGHQQYHQQQQSPRIYNRNLSATPVFSLTGHNAPAMAGNDGGGGGGFSGCSAGVDSFDWVLPALDSLDPSAAAGAGPGVGGAGAGAGTPSGFGDEASPFIGTRV